MKTDRVASRKLASQADDWIGIWWPLPFRDHSREVNRPVEWSTFGNRKDRSCSRRRRCCCCCLDIAKVKVCLAKIELRLTQLNPPTESSITGEQIDRARKLIRADTLAFTDAFRIRLVDNHLRRLLRLERLASAICSPLINFI